MKDSNLHKAIQEMPQFEAPDICGNIEKNIKPTRKKLIVPIVLLMLIAISTVLVISHYSKTPVIESANRNNELYKDNTALNLHSEDENIEETFEFTEAGDSQITRITEENTDIPEYYPADLIVYLNIDIDLSDEDLINQDVILDTNVSQLKIEERIVYKEKGVNLVRNPSFEDYRICPAGIVGRPSRKLIPDWQVPNKGTPDYFNVCSKKEAGVPINFAGRAEAHSGEGYVGIILRQNFTRDNKITGEKAVIYREYIQNELKSELVKGKTYKITFWVCNSTNSRFAVDGVGACVTVGNEWTTHKEVLEIIPVVENPTGNVLMNQNYWVAIEGYYTAQGGEKYLTIGNFKNNFSTNYMMQSNESAFNYSYYYIDDVSVIEVEEEVETYIIDENSESVVDEDNISLAEENYTDW
ncbi:MAG: hypothetical protein C0596_00545 [Marinilabiliales bacterium]|nr:MAG: hypothetical protein C0596_00545 [Marinilabiliales bacterium]